MFCLEVGTSLSLASCHQMPRLPCASLAMNGSRDTWRSLLVFGIPIKKASKIAARASRARASRPVEALKW